MKKLKCMFHSKQFRQKPTGAETGQLQKALDPIEINLSSLAKCLANGCTWKPASLSGTKSDSWTEQTLFALDFDHGTTIKDELDRCAELNIQPVFGYTSFRHSEEEHRFRLVFCNSETITDRGTRDKLQKTLIKLFPNSDNVTFDCTRMFYGGKTLIEADYDNVIDGVGIIERYGHLAEEKILIHKVKKKPVSKREANTNHVANIEAIEKLDVSTMKGILNSDVIDVVICANEDDLWRLIGEIDLQEFTGIYNTVSCIFPDHSDENPSAHIFTPVHGRAVYKCFGCQKGRAFSIIPLVEKISGCKRSEAIEFVKAVYNIKLEKTDWVKMQQQLMIDCASYLNTDEFKETYPQLSSLIRTRKHHIQLMLLHFKDFIREDLQVDGKPLFFASYKSLMNVCNIKGDRNALSQSLTLFALLNLLDKVELSKIPENELNMAKHISAQYGLKKLTGFYSFEEYGIHSLDTSERIAETLKQHNMTLKGVSR
jgi:hypothetical protein